MHKKAEAVKAQQAKMAESEAKGHGRRLEQRQGTLVTLEHEIKDATGQQAQLAAQAATLGPAVSVQCNSRSPPGETAQPMSTRPDATERAPYFTALVASSCISSPRST